MVLLVLNPVGMSEGTAGAHRQKHNIDQHNTPGDGDNRQGAISMFHVLHHSYDHSLYVNDDDLSTDTCSSMLRIKTCHVRQLAVVLGLGREATGP